MLASQQKKLAGWSRETVSIGITENGEPRRSIPVPWQNTGNAFNMRTPDIYLSPDDLTDASLWAELGRFRVVGCYIFCALTDYLFLGRLPALQDLHIRKGFFLPDLGFLTGMPEWFQLYLEDAVLPDLAPLFPDGPRKGIHSCCVCLSGCTVKDISALEHDGVRLSELVILMPEGTKERERWRNVRCGKYTYWEYKTALNSP